MAVCLETVLFSKQAYSDYIKRIIKQLNFIAIIYQGYLDFDESRFLRIVELNLPFTGSKKREAINYRNVISAIASRVKPCTIKKELIWRIAIDIIFTENITTPIENDSAKI